MVDVLALRRVNLNRLPVMWELLRCRNVSLAADNLGLTQSTVSAALKSLRELFEDELLIPSGRELVLTERAQELVPLLQATLNLLGDLISEPTFDPATDNGGFRISTADYVSTLLLPDLAKILAADAPNATIQVLPPSTKATQDLKLGIIDLIIGPEQMVDWIGARGQESNFEFESCFVDSLVCICRKGDSERRLDLDTYLDRAHASIHLQRELPASLEHDLLISKQLRQRNRFLVPDFSLLPMLVETTDMVSVIPRSLVSRYGALYDFDVFEPPIAFPPLSLSLLWLRGREKDLRFRWFLDQIREIFRRLGAEGQKS